MDPLCKHDMDGGATATDIVCESPQGPRVFIGLGTFLVEYPLKASTPVHCLWIPEGSNHEARQPQHCHTKLFLPSVVFVA